MKKIIISKLFLYRYRFVIGYVITYQYLDVMAIYIAYFAHLAARVIYLTLAWKHTIAHLNIK